MKLNGVLNNHIGMCIFSGINVWTKIVEIMLLDLSVFQQILILYVLLTTPPG